MKNLPRRSKKPGSSRLLARTISLRGHRRPNPQLVDQAEIEIIETGIEIISSRDEIPSLMKVESFFLIEIVTTSVVGGHLRSIEQSFG